MIGKRSSSARVGDDLRYSRVSHVITNGEGLLFTERLLGIDVHHQLLRPSRPHHERGGRAALRWQSSGKLRTIVRREPHALDDAALRARQRPEHRGRLRAHRRGDGRNHEQISHSLEARAMKAAVCNRRHGYISEGEGLDAVHFSGFDQGADAAPYNAAYVVAGEERILAVQGTTS